LQGILNLQQFFTSKKVKASSLSAPDTDPIIAEISEVLTQINCVRSRFEHITDYDMIDSCIYEEQALLSRYSHLLSLAKDKGLYCSHAQNLAVSRKGD